MFNLQHHFQLFKEEGAKSRFIFFTGGEKPQEIADADKKEKVFEKEDLEDPAALKDKTKMEGQATINAALEQLNIDEELKAGIKQESKDRKNYDRTVEIDGKKIHIFIKHRGREIESGVNDITP